MATLDSNCVTLAEWAKRYGPDGKPARIIEMLRQTNDMLLDMPFLEGNLPTGHRSTARTSLPTAEFRRLNAGVSRSKSTVRQADFAVGMLETYAEVDKKLADLNGNTAAFRLSESMAFIEGMNQQMAATVLYGDSSVSPAAFDGLSRFYNDLGAESGANIIDAGGTGSNLTSIWLVGWGEQGIHGIFSKGSQAGLKHEDLGEHTLWDDNGGRYQGYRDHFVWEAGVAVRDWQQGVRIANIDIDALASRNGKSPDLLELVIGAMHKIKSLSFQPDGATGRPAFYMNRTVASYFDTQALKYPTLGISTVAGAEGQFWNTFRGVPFRRMDQITTTEARVVSSAS